MNIDWNRLVAAIGITLVCDVLLALIMPVVPLIAATAILVVVMYKEFE